jgi:hypothetical protein
LPRPLPDRSRCAWDAPDDASGFSRLPVRLTKGQGSGTNFLSARLVIDGSHVPSSSRHYRSTWAEAVDRDLNASSGGVHRGTYGRVIKARPKHRAMVFGPKGTVG